MGGTGPNYTALIGTRVTGDGTPTGTLYCEGAINTQCSLLIINGYFNLYELVTAPSDQYIYAADIQLRRSTDYGVSFQNWEVAIHRNGADYWSATGWDGLYASSNSSWIVYWHDPEYGDSQLCYINWFYLTIHIHDYAGTGLVGASVPWTCTDGSSGTGTTNYLGEITLLIPYGHNVTYSVESIISACETYTGEVCSKTVSSITTNTSSTMVMYSINTCVNYDGLYIYAGGTLATCWGGNLKVEEIAVDSSYAVLSIHLPWDPDGVYSISEEIFARNSWTTTWSSGGQTFYFYIGDMWYSGESQFIELYNVCMTGRLGMDNGNIDKSLMFVDCSAGDDTHSGLCNFNNALKTITEAQTRIANNGTIKVKYGNCLGETLLIVLNPLVDTVHISPVQNETTNGTGSVVISDA